MKYLIIAKTTNMVPERNIKILGSAFFIDVSFWPQNMPRHRKINWHKPTITGTKKLLMPETALLIPAPKESMERATPMYSDSLIPIVVGSPLLPFL